MTARSTSMALCLALLLPPVPAGARWFTETRETFQAETSRKHPRGKTLVFRVPVDAPSGADVCFTYAHGRDDQPDRGAVRVRVRLMRQKSPSGPLELIDEIRFSRVAVQQRSAVECEFTAGLEAGDVAMFRFKFIRLPRLLVDGEPDLEATIQLSGSVSFRE